MRLYLIRHAESANNALEKSDPENYIATRTEDPSLTDLGFQQADRLSKYLKIHQEQFGITHLYCSAMLRALQTAQPTGKELGLQPTVWVDLHERGGLFRKIDGKFVGFQGMRKSEIVEQFPDVTLPENITENGWWQSPYGIEDGASVHYRALRVASALYARRNRDETIAIISHAGFMGVLLRAILKQLPFKIRPLYHLQMRFIMRQKNLEPYTTYPWALYDHYNTGITCIDYVDGYETVVYINNTPHLPKDLENDSVDLIG